MTCKLTYISVPCWLKIQFVRHRSSIFRVQCSGPVSFGGKNLLADFSESGGELSI